MRTHVDLSLDVTCVILRTPRRRVDANLATVAAGFRTEQPPPGMAARRQNSPTQRLRIPNDHFNRLVGVPWPSHRQSYVQC